jgi:hypothetical protein
METTTSYFERIEYNCRPNLQFDHKWSSYTSRDFADTFLSFVQRLHGNGLTCYDGAELFHSIPTTSANKKKQFQLTLFSYPITAGAAAAKSNLTVNHLEICCFAEINQDEKISLSFRFGKTVHTFLQSHLKAAKKRHDSTYYEQQVYQTDRSAFNKTFGGTVNYDSFIAFFTSTTGFETSYDIKGADRRIDAALAKLADGLFFEAGYIRNEKPNAWSHGDIERAALKGILSKPAIDKVYFGNWLRDYSSFITGASLGFNYLDKQKMAREKPFISSKAVIDLLPTMDFKITQNGLINIVNILATKDFVINEKQRPTSNFADHKKEFESNFGKITRDILGLYRPEEHIDNPKGLPDESVFADKKLKARVYYRYEKDKNKYDEKTLYPGPYEKKGELKSYDVNEETMMKRYIKENFKDRPSAFTFFSQQIRLAAEYGNSDAGYRHLGAAFHVLEDYYAHTNFVELSLIKAGKKKVNPWVQLTPEITAMEDGPAKSCKIPIVTGTFGQADLFASLAPKLGEMILPEKILEFEELKSGQRTLFDATILAVLQDHIDQRKGMSKKQKGQHEKSFLYLFSTEEVLEYFTIYLDVRDYYLDIKNGVKTSFPTIFGVIESFEQAVQYIVDGLLYFPFMVLKLLLQSVDDVIKFIQSTNTQFGSDPTHTEIAKDSPDHPLNSLAGYLGYLSVRKVGEMMQECWQSKKDRHKKTEEIIQMANTRYFVHPCNTEWMESHVKEWMDNNPGDIFIGTKEDYVEKIKEYMKMIQDFDLNSYKQKQKPAV